MYIYPRVRDIREDRDFTQADIAKYLGVGTTQYRRWETGVYEIPTHIIKELSKFYKVSADWLIGNPKNMAYPNTKITIK